MVKVHSNVYSIYVSSQSGLGESFSVCRKLSGAPNGGGWLDGHQDLLNGKNFVIDTFTSNDCRAGMVTKSKVLTVPSDNNDNVWVNLL